MMRSFRKFSGFCFTSLLILFSLSMIGCGGSGEPFTMVTTSTIIIGDPGPSSFSFLVDPIQQTVEGGLTADVVNELNDRWELVVQDLEVVANFDGIGQISLVLDPNFESTATVYKLNRNNQPFGTNTMTLSLIVETPEQNLTFSQLALSSNNAILTLNQDLPLIDFFVQGQPKQIDLASLQVLIPSELIISTEDPQLGL